MSLSYWSLFLVAFAAGVFGIKWARQTFFRRKFLPPGPPPHWLFGNEMPKEYPARAFEKLTNEYGPIISLQKGSSLWIIIGKNQPAKDILEKENASLNDRPRSIAAGKVLSGDKRILLVGQGMRFQKLRKALQSQLNIKIIESYEPVQERAAKNVVLDILENPEQHQSAAKRYAASVIMAITYGKVTPTSYSDPEVQEVNKCLARLGRAIRPGAYLVDSYPILRFIPGYLSTLQQYHREELALFRSQVDAVRQRMAANAAQPCFAKYLLERQHEYDLSDDELAYLAGSMFGAGSDTTASAISIAIMAAAVFPAAQRKVQDQLDLIVGKGRIPSFSDMEDLTEVSAYVLESYRWRTVSIGGFPHRATKDIHYGQYVIPEGAIVIANHWALSRDPDVFPDPLKFKPERWLTEQSTVTEDPKFYNFGFGRRVCPGQHVANHSLFINTAMILWAFNISQDPSVPIDTLAFTDTANTHPLPFKVKFEPRVQGLRDLIRNAL